MREMGLVRAIAEQKQATRSFHLISSLMHLRSETEICNLMQNNISTHISF